MGLEGEVFFLAKREGVALFHASHEWGLTFFFLENG